MQKTIKPDVGCLQISQRKSRSRLLMQPGFLFITARVNFTIFNILHVLDYYFLQSLLTALK
jgi:hypothetical protein